MMGLTLLALALWLAAPAAARPSVDAQVAALDRKVQAAPTDAALRRARAAVLHQAGRLDAALADLEVAARISPEPPESTLLRARVLVDMGRDPEARDTLDALLAAHGAAPAALELRARLRLRHGDPLGALDDLEAAAAAPTVERVLLLARTARRLERLDIASVALADGRAALGASPALRVEAARVLLAQHRPAEVPGTLGPVLAADPHRADARVLMADALAALGRTAEATATWRAVADDLLPHIDPTDEPAAQLVLAQALAGLEQRDAARVIVERVLREDPEDPDARALAARL
jgi:predicted Zn-dependent protease